MDADAVARRYARFARDEAPGRSALYAEWATGIAEDRDAADILARIPETHRQPPLVFAVTRLLGAPETSYAAWARWRTRTPTSSSRSARRAASRRTSR